MKICKMAVTAILDKLKKFYNFWAVQPIVTISDTEEASNVLFYTFGNYDILT